MAAKAIIFDCFGVLLNDSMGAVMDVVKANEIQRAAIGDAVRAANWGMISAPEAHIAYADALGITTDEWRKLITENEGRNVLLFEEILRLRKDFKTAILSNVSEGGLRRRFSDEELTTYFDAVIESGAVGVGKPDARIYHYALDILGVSPENAIFVDDKEHFCVGAENIGMRSIVYTTFEDFLARLNALISD